MNTSMELERRTDRKLQHLFLLVAGIIEFLFISLESLFAYFGYYAAEDYIIIPALLFLGCALGQRLSRTAKQSLILSGAAVLWFVFVQFCHKMSWMDTHPIGTFFFIYLMAFPFASVTEDGDKKAGLKLIGSIFIAASLVLVVYAVLLLLDCVPEIMAPYVYWDGTRLHPLWHSNIAACIFMIGIGFCLFFFFQTETLWKKLLWTAIAALLFAAMALTNCRTTLLMTSALVGGTVFFLIFKGGWKRLLIGLAAAVAVMVALFGLSGELYDFHEMVQTDKMLEAYQATGAVEDGNNRTLAVDPETGSAYIVGDNAQSSLTNDLRTLNGRNVIWRSVYLALRDNRSLLLTGTEYVGLTISPYGYEVVHSHNSWLEVLMRLGLPGFLFALVFSLMAVVSALVLMFRKEVPMEKKIIAMLVGCIMVAGILEPYLFITNVYYHFIDFMFFFCLGYLNQWRTECPGLRRK